MMGTGITLSERFKGLNPWKLSSLEREFEHCSTSNLSLSDILKLSSLAITFNGESKSRRPKAASSKKYTTTSLHKLFSQKSTNRDAKSEKQKSNSKELKLDQKKRIDRSHAGKAKHKKSAEELEGTRQGKHGNDKTLHVSKQMKDESSKVLGNTQQNEVTSLERPRDPRLLYGKGTYRILAKNPEEVSHSDKPVNEAKTDNSEKCEHPAISVNSGKAELVEKSGNQRKMESQDKAKNPAKKRKSFEESLLSGSGTGFEAVGKKSDGDKKIQVVKRNAVTKKITGVMEMNLKKKPVQNTEQNKPPVTEYHSSHNALKRIAESKKAEEATVADADDKIPKVVKGILKKDNPSDDSFEITKKRTKNAGTSSAKGSGCIGSELKDETKQSIVKQCKSPKEGQVKGSTKAAKPEQNVENKTVSVSPNTPNIVLKFSIMPSIDNGKINLTVVSSSEDDQEMSDSKEQKDQVDIPQSIGDSPPKSVESADKPKELNKAIQLHVTDEELKKGSPIKVCISNDFSGHTTESCASINIHSDSLSTIADTCNANTCMNGSKPDQRPFASSGCVYTTARKMAQVSTHQSVVHVNNQPPVPISYVYGTVVSPRKTKPDSTKPVPTPHQKETGTGGPQVQSASNHLMSENVPVTVCTQENMQTSNKVIRESPCKPLHQIMTAISRASEIDIESATEKETVRSFDKEITTCTGADNLEIVDMDISTPVHNAPNSNEGISIEMDVPAITIGETLEPPFVLPSNQEMDIKNDFKEPQINTNDCKVIFSSEVTNIESSLEDQLEQVSNWTTYLHEDTNSPMKSAFGSKQSFKEALSSLQSTMQISSLSTDLHICNGERTTHHQVIEISKGASSLSGKQPTAQVDVSADKNLLVCVPTKEVVSPVVSSVSENTCKVSGNADQPGSTLSSPCIDVSHLNHRNEKISVQDTPRTEIAIPSDVGCEKGNVTCIKTTPQERVTDERNSLLVPNIEFAKSGNGDQPESHAKTSVVSKGNVVDTGATSRVNVHSRGIFEEKLKLSKSPGTPVEDEFSDQGPIETQSTTKKYTSLTSEGLTSKRYLEENNNDNEKVNCFPYAVKDARNRDQSEFPQRLNRGIDKYPDSLRNGTKPVYMRELSNVSDISMGDEFDNVGEHYNQEALEPLLVRGSTTRDTRKIDHIEYQRDTPRKLRKNLYGEEGNYSDKSMSSHSREQTYPHYSQSPKMERNADIKRVDSYLHPPQEVHRCVGSITPPPNERYDKDRDSSYSYQSERGHIYEALDRTSNLYEEGQSLYSNMIAVSDGEPSRRNTGGHNQGTGHQPMISEQMTAVQALQLQINAAVNPAHRAALVLALQALTGTQVQSPTGKVPPQAKVSTDPDSQSRYSDVPDKVSSNHFHDDNVYRDPSNRKVEFTVVLRDDDEQLLRKDSAKKLRTGETGKVQRPSYNVHERFSDSSMKQDYNYYRTVELSGDSHSYSSQDALKKDRRIAHEISRTLEFHKAHSYSTSSECVSDRHLSSRERHEKASTEGNDKKEKKSVTKKSKRKVKDFHGRPLIKDKTNKTNPHLIPLENEDTVHKRIDPRRSLTPDPACGPKELRRLKWGRTSVGDNYKISRSKVRKHRQKDKAPQTKPNENLSCSKKLNSKQEEVDEGILKRSSLVKPLVKESVNGCFAERDMHTEAVCEKDGKTSNGKLEVLSKDSEMSDKSVHVIEQTIEEYVNEARLASNKGDGDNEEQNYHKTGKIHGHCRTNKDQIETTKCSSLDSTSVDHINIRKESENEKSVTTSRESVTPDSSHSVEKKKRRSPDSKQHDYDDDRHDSYKETTQNRKLRERTPERHKKYRHTRKRKYSSDSESDIDSDREQVCETQRKLKRYGQFSRFSKACDLRSARSGPFRSRSGIRSHTPFQRFDYKKYIFPGNLGKPYGNQRTISTCRGRGRGFLHGCAPLFIPRRERGHFTSDITREGKNSPTMSMAALGYKNITPWEDIHVDLSEIKAKMHAVEKSSREVRKASSQLQVAPLMKVHRSAFTALECIMTEVSNRISYDRREMYLHRRKYEILMADIRIHAEVLGKLIPPDQEEVMMSKFVPNTTGIPRIKPTVELKVLNWLSGMKNSGMLMAVQELMRKKIRNLEERVNAMKALERKQARRLDDHMNRHIPRSRQWSGSDISPDSTKPEGENDKDAEQITQNSETSPEVFSCPEFGPSTPVTQVQNMPEAFSEIRLPTDYLVAYHEDHPEPSPSIAFRNPPEPVRKLISTSQGNQALVDIPIPCDFNENGSFNLVDITPPKDQSSLSSDQNAKTCKDLQNKFNVAESGSVHVTDTPQKMSVEHPAVPDVSCDRATPTGYVNSLKPSTPSTFVSQPMIYISRVQRFASKTLMSPESGSDLQTLLKSEVEKNLKRNKGQWTSSSSDDQLSQGDIDVGKSEVKSSRYSKKRHFLAKFQSEGSNKSQKGNFPKLCKSPELSCTRIDEKNLNKMYNEYDESCLTEEGTKESSKVHNQKSSPPTANAESLSSNVGL